MGLVEGVQDSHHVIHVVIGPSGQPLVCQSISVQSKLPTPKERLLQPTSKEKGPFSLHQRDQRPCRDTLL